MIDYDVANMKNMIRYENEDYTNPALYKRKSFTDEIILQNLDKIDFALLFRYRELNIELFKKVMDYFIENRNSVFIKGYNFNLCYGNNINVMLSLFYYKEKYLVNKLTKEIYLHTLVKLAKELSNDEIESLIINKHFVLPSFFTIDDLACIYDINKIAFYKFSELDKKITNRDYFNYRYATNFLKNHLEVFFDMKQAYTYGQKLMTKQPFSIPSDFVQNNIERFDPINLIDLINCKYIIFNDLPNETKNTILKKIITTDNCQIRSLFISVGIRDGDMLEYSAENINLSVKEK